MKKILIALVVSLTIFIVGCQNSEYTVNLDIMINQWETVEVETNTFAFEISDTFHITDEFIITEVVVTRSDYGVVPRDNLTVTNDLEDVQNLTQKIFDDIDNQDIYLGNTYPSILIGTWTVLEIHLVNDSREFICEFYLNLMDGGIASYSVQYNEDGLMKSLEYFQDELNAQIITDAETFINGLK